MTNRTTMLLIALAAALAFALPSSAAAAPGDISTVAGNGTLGIIGDGGPATSAEVASPRDVAALPGGGFLIADTGNNEIRMVSPAGVITTVAGTGTSGYNGDDILATTAQLSGPRGVEPLPGGGFLIADFFNHRVRYVDPGGVIHTVAGDGTGTSGGDGGPATAAGVEYPRDISRTPDGGFLIGEHLADCVRKVSASGIINTAAGICGSFGDSGNGGPATAAMFRTVNGVSSFPNGSFIVTDGNSDAVRIVGTDGIIRQAAGNGTSGFSGDGGPAVNAAIDGPRQAVALPDGSFFFADHNNNRVRLVSSTGVISTVAGKDTLGSFSGDGGCARNAELNGPESVAALSGATSPATGVLIPDADNQRIRSVEGTDFTFEKVKKKVKKGVTVLQVKFPGPGTYAVGGNGVKSLAGFASSPALTSADKVKLRIRATGKKRKKLNRKGKVKVAPTVTYTPTCWAPVSKTTKVKLIKRR
jgi:hypothetical protein